MKWLILVLLVSYKAPAQVPAKEPEPIIVDPETMPEFKGGEAALMRYIQDSVKNKAIVSLEESYVLQRAYAKFTISETGKVSNVRIIKSSQVPHIDSLFKSALEHMPDWTPGSFNGQVKSTEMYFPLKLELR